MELGMFRLPRIPFSSKLSLLTRYEPEKREKPVTAPPKQITAFLHLFDSLS